MKIEFDDNKNPRYVRERGLSFELVGKFNFDTALIIEDARHSYGENRYRALCSGQL